ncbi:MAG: DUF3775 domain-containing protein [Parasphingopyxis sp.]|uniref:DUF3775 domain-containing protein n=1 Tax=Parasphingopyxis sp. TaxID=1920299 RepID=UPI00263925A0|nr:DUF3775 domain-containing protein [uncultured Parasphingopyxis sp.]
MELETPLDTICRLIVRAREWDSQVPENDEEDDRDDPVSTDDQYDVMLDEKNEAVETEIQALLDDLADDETAEVLALAWIGRGTFEPEDWEDALAEASDGERNDAADQLMDMPMLAAYLEAGLAAFGMSCEGIGQLD